MSELHECFQRPIYEAELERVNTEKTYACIAILKPTLSVDGDQYCYLLGDNLQEGIAGYGDTVFHAMQAFEIDLHIRKVKMPKP